jgi:Molybdopterin oxidoreductase Fe4S4 domain
MSETRIPGFCALCKSRCGSILVARDGRFVGQEPNPEHPTGQSLCVKGRAATQDVGIDRLPNLQVPHHVLSLALRPAHSRCHPLRYLHSAVAGGSIGGLCAGLALRGAGFDVQVYERISSRRYAGLGRP